MLIFTSTELNLLKKKFWLVRNEQQSWRYVAASTFLLPLTFIACSILFVQRSLFGKCLHNVFTTLTNNNSNDVSFNITNFERKFAVVWVYLFIAVYPIIENLLVCLLFNNIKSVINISTIQYFLLYSYLYKIIIVYNGTNIFSLFSVGPAPYRSCLLCAICYSSMQRLSTLYINC